MERDANLQIRAIRENARSTIGSRYDYDSLVELAGTSRFALLGEASHGTHDFYQTRVQITQRLIEEKGYTAVAVEADWPDAYRVNLYVQGRGGGRRCGRGGRFFQAVSDLDVAQHGRDRVYCVAARVQRCFAGGKAQSRLLRSGFVQSACLRTGGARLPGQG